LHGQFVYCAAIDSDTKGKLVVVALRNLRDTTFHWNRQFPSDIFFFKKIKVIMVQKFDVITFISKLNHQKMNSIYWR